MKVISLSVENLKKIIAVEIRPDGNLVQITGKNGMGKTSILDSIWFAMAGGRAIQAEPIRKGCEIALIKLDLGELKITRKFTAKEEGGFTTSITVENAAGTRLQSPQNVLDAVLGALTFDPLAVTRMKPSDQFDMFKGFVEGVDFAVLASEDKADFEERTTVNRRAKELRAQAEGIALPAGAVPKRVDVAALEQKLGDAADHNTALERRRNQRQAFVDSVAERRAELVELRERIAGLEQQIKEGDEKLAAAEVLPEAIDVADVRDALSVARQGNVVADSAARKASLEAQAKAAEEEALLLTRKMEKREADKQAAIAAAKMPVEGLGFAGETVTLDGFPFEQASAARQLRAAVAIAAAMNPKLRIIRISDGSLLDDDAMAWLGQFAEEQDMQVWIERVDGSGTVGFVIENGMLKSDEPEDSI